MAYIRRPSLRAIILGTALVTLAACDQPFDLDLRRLGGGLSTSDAAINATADRPSPDDRGVLSYPNYQVAIARRGDSISDVATRVGLPAEELARYNGIPSETVLRANEVIALPRRVTEPSPETGAIISGPIQPAGNVDIGALAGGAIDRAGSSAGVTTTPIKSEPKGQTGAEPIRHKVERGETAYSIARLYNISVRSLADWNGLGPELGVREGQYVLIPVATEKPATTGTSAPGQGSTTPVPPSSTTALPDEKTTKPDAPTSPNLGNKRSSASDTSKLLMPVNGKIIRSFVKKKNDGIDIAADAGSPVKAAANGTVAAITRDTDQVPILVLRHANNLLTVYAGVDGVSVKKGDKVKRGQTIAKVRAGKPSFVHFEVRQGFDSVDPVPFLN